MPYLTDQFGDPSSRSHAWGWAAEEAVDRARDQVATLIGAQPEEIFFTSGATESDNLAIKGIARAYNGQGRHIVTQQTEHRAILDSCRTLEQEGFTITYLPGDRHGLVDPDAVRHAITDDTILVSIMHANNEVGTIQPLAEIGAIVKARGVLFHSDAVQTVGKIACNVDDLQLDLLSISAIKCMARRELGHCMCVRPARAASRLRRSLMGGAMSVGSVLALLTSPASSALARLVKSVLASGPKRGSA